MNWEEMFDALRSTGAKVELCMRKPGDWYVSASMELVEGPILNGAYGNGRTPQEAVEKHWAIYSMAPEVFVTMPALMFASKTVAWNGYMWRTLPLIRRKP